MPESPESAPISTPKGSRCGTCGGQLYLEPEGALSAAQAAYLTAARHARQQEQAVLANQTPSSQPPVQSSAPSTGSSPPQAASIGSQSEM